MKHSEAINMKLWRHAIPLSQADITYAPKHLKEKWGIASNKSVIDSVQSEMKAANGKSDSTMDFIGNLLQSAQPLLSERTKIRAETRKVLCTHIDNERLLAFAFEKPRTIRSEPVELPPEYWREFVNWESDKIRSQSMEFIEVRILHPETAKRLRAAELPAPREPLTVGRPTVQPQIIEAFTILLEAGVIDVTASMKSAFPPLQEWIKTHHPEALGDKEALSNETIRRTIAPLFKDAKSAQIKKQ